MRETLIFLTLLVVLADGRRHIPGAEDQLRRRRNDVFFSRSRRKINIHPTVRCVDRRTQSTTRLQPTDFTSAAERVNVNGRSVWKYMPILHLAKLPSPPGMVVGGVFALLVGKAFTMPSVQRAFYFWRKAGPMVAHYKFTQFWLKQTGADLETRDRVYEQLHNRYAAPSLELILHLKGLYCKIGQVLSTRQDFIPTQYVVKFATVQDSIPQRPVEEIAECVQSTLKENLALEYRDVFESIDEIALGSASIGQVHQATLRKQWAERLNLKSSERHVAIKVMHPGAKKRFANDFQVFRWLCRVALPGWGGLLNELESRIMAEFDYRNEAEDMDEVRRNVENSEYRTQVRVPQPEKELCTKNLLVMEMLKGSKLVDALEDGLTDVFDGNRDKAARYVKQQQELMMLGKTTSSDVLSLKKGKSLTSLWKMKRLQTRYKRLLTLLLAVHGHHIFADGLYNGDPHPGNCLELHDGRLGLVDFGQVQRINDEDRLGVARIVTALAQGESASEVAMRMRELGFRTQDSEDDTIMKDYATIFFDSDFEAKGKGFSSPQHWFADMMERNPLVDIPESSIFIARSSFLFRGLGKGLDMPPVRTSMHWEPHAREAISQLGSVDENQRMSRIRTSDKK